MEEKFDIWGWPWLLESFPEVPLLSIIPDRSDHKCENFRNKSGQICPFCQSQDFDNHNCEMYEKALSQSYCTLCQLKVEEGFMKIHLELDCKIIKFFGIQIPQPYIEPEVSTYSGIMIQDVYSLGKSTGKLHCTLWTDHLISNRLSMHLDGLFWACLIPINTIFILYSEISHNLDF